MSSDEANQIARDGQRRWRLRGAATLMLPTAAALGAGAAIAVGAIPGSDGTITGCYLTNTGNAPGLRIGELRLIDPSQSPTLPGGGPNPAAVCLSDETQIAWNQSGPTGPAGAAGLPGPAGIQGPAGTAALLPAVQFGFDNAAAGGMFLKLDGVTGPITGGTHKGDFEISSFSFGSTHQVTGNAGSGAGAGRTSFSSFRITKQLDKSSTSLEASSLDGKQFKDVEVFFARKAGGEQKDYLEMKLENVLISSYQVSGSGAGRPLETIVLSGIKGEASFITGNAKVDVNLKLENAT